MISSNPFVPLWPINVPFLLPVLTTGGEETSHAAAVASSDNYNRQKISSNCSHKTITVRGIYCPKKNI